MHWPLQVGIESPHPLTNSFPFMIRFWSVDSIWSFRVANFYTRRDLYSRETIVQGFRCLFKRYVFVNWQSSNRGKCYMHRHLIIQVAKDLVSWKPLQEKNPCYMDLILQGNQKDSVRKGHNVLKLFKCWMKSLYTTGARKPIGLNERVQSKTNTNGQNSQTQRDQT